VQEAGERDRVVAGDRLGDDVPSGDVQRGDDGDGAVADVLELPAGRAAGAGSRPGYLRYFAWMPVFSSMQITMVSGGGRR
jgi:hypothetical protein